MNQTASTPTLPGPSQAPDFKQVRKYLRIIQHREAFGQFIKAGWTPEELGEFARQVFLAPGKTHPTAASYQHAMEKGAEHPYAHETLVNLRAPGFTMPSFNRPALKAFAWDDADSPEHTAELRADIEEMGRLWRNREAGWRGEPLPEAVQPIPKSLWSRLFRLRNHYHSLEDTLWYEGLSEEIQGDVLMIARCRSNRAAHVLAKRLHGEVSESVMNDLVRPDPNKPIPADIWKKCFNIRARFSSLEKALEHEGLADYR